jgi:hypothetical protein
VIGVPRKATKDTYGIEMIGDVEVRRQVFAGDMIPVTIAVDDGDYEEVEGGETVIGASAEPPPKKKSGKS